MNVGKMASFYIINHDFPFPADNLKTVGWTNLFGVGYFKSGKSFHNM
jgi:hypothetical protein